MRINLVNLAQILSILSIVFLRAALCDLVDEYF